MKLLILGGTRFIGRYITERALNNGHEVTHFNRGNHTFPEVETLIGDREGDLSPLEGRSFDAVIDTSGFFPRTVSESASRLAKVVDHYTFISTISVYKEFGEKPCTEDSPVHVISEEEAERVTSNGYVPPEHYGALKALAEKEVEKHMPSRALHIRPGLVVGPHDYSDRFTYWVKRLDDGGDVLAPGKPQRPIQFIDVRDLANCIVEMTEKKVTGVYNVTGAERHLTMGELLDTCKRVSGSKALLHWLDEEFLLSQGVTPWSDLPLWLPESHNAAADINVDKAIAQGLTFRPIEETVADTLAWLKTRDPSLDWKAGLDREKEKKLLNKTDRMYS